MTAARFLRRLPHIAGLLALTLILTLILPLPAGIRDVGAQQQTSPYPDFDSAAAFEQTCTNGGGTISRTTGSIGCYYPGGAIIVCDQNGKNCTFFPAPPQPSDGSGNPFSISDDVEQVQLVEETPTSGPSADPGNIVQVPLMEETPTDTTQDPAPTAEPSAEPGEGALDPTPTPTVAPTQEPSGNQVPSDAATLSLTVRTCPAGYDPFGPGAAPENECRNPAGAITFHLDGVTAATAVADGAGTVQFENLAPGEYVLTSAPAAGEALAFVDGCQSTSRDLDDHPFFPAAVAGPAGAIGLRLAPEEILACTWYVVPEAAAATVVALLRWCAGDVITSTGCDPYADGFGLTLTPSDGSDAVTVETDGDGRAVFHVPGGTYALSQEDGRAWCFAQGEAFDEEGRLVVGDGATIEVELYNCGALP